MAVLLLMLTMMTTTLTTSMLPLLPRLLCQLVMPVSVAVRMMLPWTLDPLLLLEKGVSTRS